MALSAKYRCISVILSVLGLVGCSIAEGSELSTDLAQEMAALEQRASGLIGSTDAVEERVNSDAKRVAAVLTTLDQAATAYQAASTVLKQAALLSASSTKQQAQAKAEFENAAQAYRIAAYSVVALAMTTAAAQTVCATRMSTHEYRVRNGITDSNTHVDHILPRALGGADHPLNYQPLDAHTNMSCGAGCLPDKLMGSPLALATGVAVSVLAKLGCP